MNGKSGGKTSTRKSAVKEATADGEATEKNQHPVLSAEPMEDQRLMDGDEIVNPSPTNSSVSDGHSRKSCPDFIDDLSSDNEKNRETTCDCSEQFSSKKNLSKSGSILPHARTPNRLCFPLLSGERPGRPFISLHAGLLLLAPEFEQSFGELPAILRQTGAQILTGCGRRKFRRHFL